MRVYISITPREGPSTPESPTQVASGAGAEDEGFQLCSQVRALAGYVRGSWSCSLDYSSETGVTSVGDKGKAI